MTTADNINHLLIFLLCCYAIIMTAMYQYEKTKIK